jgi:hypothetical protein
MHCSVQITSLDPVIVQNGLNVISYKSDIHKYSYTTFHYVIS